MVFRERNIYGSERLLQIFMMLMEIQIYYKYFFLCFVIQKLKNLISLIQKNLNVITLKTSITIVGQKKKISKRGVLNLKFEKI